ncbi:MAG: NAD(P)H-dependent oxidoreductase [Bacteroidetes bacterium]|nr:NAD(P)H-dependent oxidoreductase [Bacteroidota bacterium]
MTSIISATHRPNSYTHRVASWLYRELQNEIPNLQFIDLQDLPHTFLFDDLYGKRSEAFGKMEKQLRNTGKFLFVVPEYNGSIPGVVKLLIDALPRDVFSGKKAAMAGVSSGKFGNLRGLEHLNGIFNYIQLHTLPFRAHLPRIETVISPEGEITDAAAEKELRILMERFAAF